MIWNPSQLEEVRECAFCHGPESRKCIDRPDGLPVHTCSDCGFSYLKLRPNEEALAAYYDSRYFQNSGTYQDYFNYADAVSDLGFCPRLARLSHVIPPSTGLRVLEVGCAAGSSLHLLHQMGAEVQGIEISNEAAEFGRRKYGVPILGVPLEKARLPEAAYSLVMMFDVLEHLPDPANALKQLHAAMRYGGILALSVPNFDRFDTEGPAWPGISGYFEHLNYFRGAILKKHLQAAGFRVMDQYTYTTSEPSRGDTAVSLLRMGARTTREKFPGIYPTLRQIRRLRFRLFGPPVLDIRKDESGMDRFVIARKTRGVE